MCRPRENSTLNVGFEFQGQSFVALFSLINPWDRCHLFQESEIKWVLFNFLQPLRSEWNWSQVLTPPPALLDPVIRSIYSAQHVEAVTEDCVLGQAPGGQIGSGRTADWGSLYSGRSSLFYLFPCFWSLDLGRDLGTGPSTGRGVGQGRRSRPGPALVPPGRKTLKVNHFEGRRCS